MWVGALLVVVVSRVVDGMVWIVGCVGSEICVLGVDGGSRVVTERG